MTSGLARLAGYMSLYLMLGGLSLTSQVALRSDLTVSPRRSTAKAPARVAWFRDRLVPVVERDGRLFFEGDILVNPESSSKRHTSSAAVARDERARWPSANIPYVIDERFARNANLAVVTNAAIEHWQQKTVYRFVQRTNEPDYIVFRAQEEGCFAHIGRIGGPQVINLDNGCLRGQAIHEIGHALGLFHEQSRNDRDGFVRVMESNIDPDTLDNFAKTGVRGSDYGFYDFASIMHYEAFAFSINRLPVLESVPVGIPFGQRDQLSPGDIDAAHRLLPGVRRPFVVDTNPSGMNVAVDGANCTSPCFFYNWTPGSTHRVDVSSPQRPAAARRDYFFARWADGLGQSHEFTADPNRTVLTAHFSTNPPADGPDLVITKVTAPRSAEAGGQIPGISMEVKNVGGAAAGSFRVGLYMSANETIELSDRSMDASCRFDGLAAGATATCSGAVTAAANLPEGRYWIGAYADTENTVNEKNEQNNGSANENGTTEVKSQISARPDLVMVRFSADNTGVAGLRIANLQLEIRNRGSAATGPFRIGFYLSQSPNVDPSATYTGWSCAEKVGLAAGDTWTCTGEIGIPEQTRPGTWRLGAVADDLGQVDESDEANNTRDQDNGPLTVRSLALGDLTVESFSAPTNAVAGETIETMRAVIRNQGTLAVSNFRIGFYLSATERPSTKDVFTGWSCAVKDEVAPGGTWTCSGQVGIPSGVAPGKWYLAAIADDQNQVQEPDESNNGRVNDAGQMQIAVPNRADLTIRSLEAPVRGVINSELGEMKIQISNHGTAKAGAFQVGFYFSSDDFISTSDIYTGWVCEYPEGLDAGSTASCSGPIGIPEALTAGAWYFGAVIDSLDQVREVDEQNNWRAADSGRIVLSSQALPDLVVESFSASTSGVSGGSLEDVRFVARNIGTASSAPFRAGFYFSQNETITPYDIFTEWYCTVEEGLEPGETWECGGRIGIPQSVRAGNWYVGVLVDDQNAVRESDEENNTEVNDSGLTRITSDPASDAPISGTELTGQRQPGRYADTAGRRTSRATQPPAPMGSERQENAAGVAHRSRPSGGAVRRPLSSARFAKVIRLASPAVM